MNGEELFRRCCEDLDLDFEEMFFFQVSQSYLRRGSRIQQNYISKNIPEKQYIVRYYPTEDIFFVWYHILGRNSGSLKIPNDFAVEPNELLRIAKRRGDNLPETVFAFTSNGIHTFFEEVVLAEF